MDLKELGFTKEEVLEKVIENIVAGIEDQEFRFYEKINAAIAEAIDRKVNDIAEKHIIPKVGESIETIVLQKTNEWGEKKGEEFSFREYLVHRAEQYMLELVDYQGKTSAGLYSKRDQTRITYLIEEYLHFSIENAMKNSLKIANKTIVEGLKKTVEVKLKEISAKLESRL